MHYSADLQLRLIQVLYRSKYGNIYTRRKIYSKCFNIYCIETAESLPEMSYGIYEITVTKNTIVYVMPTMFGDI